MNAAQATVPVRDSTDVTKFEVAAKMELPVKVQTRVALTNILFATDFSAAAEAALPFALQIAKRYGAKVYGLHVNEFENYALAAPEAFTAMAGAAEEEAKRDMQLLNEELADVEHEAIVVEGNVLTVAAGIIAEKHIDLVILGTHGRTGFGKALMGSMAERILRQAPCPVLTVGPHVALAPEKAVKMQEILYATELAAEYPVATPYAISIAQENQAHLTLLHVLPAPKAGDLVHPEQLRVAVERRLTQLLPKKSDLWFEPQALVKYGDAAEKILEIAQLRQADLIVLGAHPANDMLGAATHLNAGLVHQVVSQATCPVLTVRG